MLLLQIPLTITSELVYTFVYAFTEAPVCTFSYVDCEDCTWIICRQRLNFFKQYEAKEQKNKYTKVQ